jgi:hypothetical protein
MYHNVRFVLSLPHHHPSTPLEVRMMVAQELEPEQCLFYLR